MSGARVLLVEDEGIVAMDLQQRLFGLGYVVVGTAATGADAVRLAEERTPDVVLMDIRLKGPMDGIEAAERIRVLCGCPVIYLTAHNDEATLRRAKVTEPYAYLLKPVEEREVHSAIEIALYKHDTVSRLRRIERWLASTLRSIGDGVIATDTGGAVVYMNRVAEILAQQNLSDVRGRDLSTVLRIAEGRSRTPVRDLVRRVVEGGIVINLSPEAVLLTPDGREMAIDDSAAPIREPDGTITGCVIVFRDAAPRLAAEASARAVVRPG